MLKYPEEVIKMHIKFPFFHTNQGIGRYQAGIEVICDMAALSHCRGLISGLSQVGLMARIFKRSRHERYQYDKKLNMGINTSGRGFSV